MADHKNHTKFLAATLEFLIMVVCVCSKEFPKLRNRQNLICVDFITNSVYIADYPRYFVF